MRAAGVPIVASRIDAPFNRDDSKPSELEWAAHWQRCVREAAEADVVLFVALEGERQCGALLEAGAALAAGRRVFVVSCYVWSFANHPRCRKFSSVAEAVGAVRAGGGCGAPRSLVHCGRGVVALQEQRRASVLRAAFALIIVSLCAVVAAAGACNTTAVGQSSQ